MRRLILVKHALPEISPERPRREWRLSEEGRVRCGHLARRLLGFRPDRVITSPEPKAHETATAVAETLGGLSVETVEELHEHDDSDVGFLGESSFRSAVKLFFARPTEAVFGPETADDAHARFAAAIDDLPAPRDDSSHVVVAHGRVISLFVARRNDLDAFALWERLGLPSFVALEVPGYRTLDVVDRV